MTQLVDYRSKMWRRKVSKRESDAEVGRDAGFRSIVLYYA